MRCLVPPVILCHDGGMRIHIAADHAGFELKEALIEHLTAAGHDVVNHGALTYDPLDDYPSFCFAAGEAVVAELAAGATTAEVLGVVIGGSGNGEQIAANKVKGARCGLAWSVETAQLTRQHNDAQLIGIGGRMHSVEDALAIVDAFIATPFSGDPRHQRRIDTLLDYDATGVAPAVPGAAAE